MPHTYGLIKGTEDRRDFKYVSHLLSATQTLPTKVDLTADFPPIMDQGNIGSCVGNSVGSVLAYTLNRLKSTRKFKTGPSRLFVYCNGKIADKLDVTQDSGCSVRGAMKGCSKFYCCDESIYPYVIENALKKPVPAAYTAAHAYRNFQYYNVPQNLFAIKKCIADGSPVILGIAIYNSFESDECMKTGIVPMPKKDEEELLGYHCINLCGYDDTDKTFLLRNSWGTDVGLPKQRGYFKIPYQFVLDSALASDFWKITMFG
jgi:C1A family cysteine protease